MFHIQGDLNTLKILLFGCDFIWKQCRLTLRIFEISSLETIDMEQPIAFQIITSLIY